MKLIRLISRGVRDAFKSVFRNFSLSIASISCTVITLLLVSIGILVSYNIKKITTDIENDLTIVAFIERDATSEEEQGIKKELEAMGHEVIDYGCDSTDSVDYPDYGYKAAKAVATQSENGIPMPNIPEMQEVWKPAGDALQLVVTDKEAPKAALDSAVKQIKGNIEANHNKKK